MILLKRTRKGHCQSDEHWNCFKCNVGDTSERWIRRICPDIFECIDNI